VTPDPQQRLIDAHEHAATYYRTQLLAADAPRRYLDQRGLGSLTRPDLPWRPGTDLPWRLGYAPPGWRNLLDHLTTAGYTPTELETAGLATRTRDGRLIDTFRDRITMPIHNEHGHTIAFIGRAAPNAPTHTPKYLNSPDTAIYHKGQTLYGLPEQHERLAAGWAPTFVEGPLDVLAVWLAFPPTAGLGRVGLAPCGTSLTAAQVDTIAHHPATQRHGLVVAFDNDPAGNNAADRAFQLLTHHHVLQLHAAQLPKGADPGSLATHPNDLAELRASLTHRTRPLAETLIDQRITALIARHPRLLVEVEGQVAAIRAVAPIISRTPAEQATQLVSYVAQITDADITTVANEVLAVFDTERDHAAPRARSPSGTWPQHQPQPTPPAEPLTPSPERAHPVLGITRRHGRRAS
jgi:DNA primase